MGVFKLSYLPVLCLVALAILDISHARTPAPAKVYLDAHNKARAQVGVRPMRWDSQLARLARNYLRGFRATCHMVHSISPFGENLAWSGGDLSGEEAVAMWVEEKAYYNHNSNTCRSGEQCGHYTQVVWRDSVHIGCAKIRCFNGGTLIGCNYDPPGNYLGERPY